MQSLLCFFLQENGNFGLPKVTSTMLMAPGGKDFIHLMFKFSTYVLYKCLGKLVAILKAYSHLFNQAVQDLLKILTLKSFFVFLS